VRAFRFGVVFTGAADRRGFTELARGLEGDGFSSLLVADHYVNPMACTPMITAAAMVTTTLRVGSYVYGNDFRHPALLAKEAATIDVLSEGRFELGIGAGWLRDEYVQAGVAFDEPGVRVGRFEESVGIIRRLLDGEQVEHQGEHYRLHKLAGEPLPVQRRIPLLIGAGARRMVSLAGREAEIVGFVPPALRAGGLDVSAFSEDAFAQRIGWLDEAVAAGRRADGGPERSVLMFASGEAPAADDDLGWMDGRTAATSPYALVGSVDAMCDTLQERRERWGVTYVVCWEEDIDLLRPVVARLA